MSGRFSVVLSRHVLWALPDAAAVLDRWIRLLEPNGALVLIEGHWHTGSGLRAADVMPLVQSRMAVTSFRDLTQGAVLWGGAVADERYLITGRSSADQPASDSL